MSLKIRIIPCLDVKDGRVVKGVNFVELVDAGDHHVVIGQVNDFGWRDAAALGFWRSQFGRFEAQTA